MPDNIQSGLDAINRVIAGLKSTEEYAYTVRIGEKLDELEDCYVVRSVLEGLQKKRRNDET